mmetsp:Transcript_94298/g.236720  ORF Transcript_94298/g.236720 Transcript_94298/m.236720 type:complete len:255 (+) Transcript_94298:2056-2820(+)
MGPKPGGARPATSKTPAAGCARPGNESLPMMASMSSLLGNPWPEGYPPPDALADPAFTLAAPLALGATFVRAPSPSLIILAAASAVSLPILSTRTASNCCSSKMSLGTPSQNLAAPAAFPRCAACKRSFFSSVSTTAAWTRKRSGRLLALPEASVTSPASSGLRTIWTSADSPLRIDPTLGLMTNCFGAVDLTLYATNVLEMLVSLNLVPERLPDTPPGETGNSSCASGHTLSSVKLGIRPPGCSRRPRSTDPH